MVNPFKEVNWRPDRAGLRSFAKSLIIGFPIVASILLIGGRLMGGVWNVSFAAWLAGIGAGLGVVFLAVPSISRPFYVVWYAVACSIGLVVSNLLLLSVFYLVFVPIGVILRVARRRPIETTVDRARATYWLAAEQPTDRSRYLRQF